MAYSPQEWNNGPSGATPLDAARLNYMEAGIAEMQVSLNVVAPVTANASIALNTLQPANANGGAISSLALPGGGAKGDVVAAVKTDSSPNTVTLTGSIMGGSSTYVLSNQNETVWLVADSSGSWWPLSNHPGSGGGGGTGVIKTGSDQAGSVTGWGISPVNGSVQLASDVWTNIIGFLPTAASYGKNLLYIKNSNTQNYHLIIQPAFGGDTIDNGQITMVTLQPHEAMTVWSDGVSTWKILGVYRNQVGNPGKFEFFAGPDIAYWEGFPQSIMWGFPSTAFNSYSGGGAQYTGPETFWDVAASNFYTNVYDIGYFILPFTVFAAAGFAVVNFPEISIPAFSGVGSYVYTTVTVNCISLDSSVNGTYQAFTKTFDVTTYGSGIDYQYTATDFGSLFQYGTDLSVVAGTGSGTGLVSGGAVDKYSCSVQFEVRLLGGGVWNS